MSRAQDVIGVLRGLQCVTEAAIKLQEESFRHFWNNSSLRHTAAQVGNSLKTKQPGDIQSAASVLTKTVRETADRFSTVLAGVREFSSLKSSGAAAAKPQGKK